MRVLLADDDPHVRQALTELVDAEPSLQVVAVAAAADDAVALAREQTPDVAVIDVRMPGSGHQAVRGVRAQSPKTRVLALSAYGDHGAVVGMIASGAVGYLVKGAAGQEIVAAIHRAVAGGATLSSQVATSVVGELTDQLSEREREVADRTRIRSLVEQALEPGALTMVFQPVVALVDRGMRGVEALARFEPEPRKPPDWWFASAWQVGLGPELEMAAVRAALLALDVLPAGQFLAINVSPQTACLPEFALALTAGSHQRLVVEVTEHAPVNDYEALGACLEEPRRAGLRLAIDDAGAGYASLQHILGLAPDIIKLDMSLTRSIHTDPRRRALVAALVPFADEIDATVVAEGIETDAELSTLRGFGAAWGQGYLLGRPGPLAVSPGSL